MRDAVSSRERAPLLVSASSSSSSTRTITDTERNGKVEQPVPWSFSRGALVAASLGFLIFLQGSNISMLSTIQSSIAADLDAYEKATWFTSSYLIAISSLAPLMGRLSQVFSPRLSMFSSTIFIAVGTIITATSTTFETFIVGRAVTGSGAAGVLVVAVIIVVQMVDERRRGLFLGCVNAGMTVGISLGAIIAGALEPKIGWKPLFGFQAPLSLLAGFGLLFGIPADYTSNNNKYKGVTIRQKLAQVDYSGSLLLVTTIILFLLGLSGPHILVLPLVLSAVALPLFILNEIYVARDPVIPIAVLKHRGTLLTCVSTTGFMMARWGILFYTPVYALAVRGWSPAVAGSILIPTNAGFASGGLLAGYIHIHRGGSFYPHSLISMGIFPITLLALSFISTATSSSVLYIFLVFCNGLLTGAATNYTLVHLIHLASPDVHPIVLSLLTTFRGFAGSFGSAIGGGLFARVINKSLTEGFEREGLTHREDLTRRLLGSPGLVQKLDGMEKAIAVGAYEDGLKALFLAGVGLAVVVVVIQAGTGWKEPVQPAEERTDEDEVEEGEALIAES